MSLSSKITSFLTFRHFIEDLSDKDYSYKINICEKDIDYNTARLEIESLLKKSIKSYECDKISVMMSGGIDSMFLAYLIKNVFPNKNITAYTAVLDNESEHNIAIKACEKFGIKHKTIKIEKEDYLDIDKWLIPLIKHKNAPLHPNEIALAKCEYEAKKDGCDIAFCGEGSDDIFAGYSNIFTCYKEIKGNETIRDFAKRFLDSYRYFSLKDRLIIKEEFLLDDYDLLNTFTPDIFEHSYSFGHYFIQRIHTPGLINRGKNAMSFNDLTPAFPFMDSELVDYVNSLPMEYKIFGNQPKCILRDLASLYIKELSQSPKNPFPMPFKIWMEGVDKYDLSDIFITDDISHLSPWHKWMIINLNTWYKICK